MGISIEQVLKQIQGVLMGAAKTAAVQSLNQEMGSIISGGSSGPMFVTDWRVFLFTNPEKEAAAYMNSYLGQITKGRGSASGYQANSNINFRFSGRNFEGVGPGAFEYGLAQSNPEYAGLIKAARAQGILPSAGSGNNYIQQLVESAKKSTFDREDPRVTYVGHPNQMFAQGNFKNLNLYLSGINNPWAFNLNAQQEYQKEKARLEKIASDKAVAGEGFLGKEKDGKTITPGSLVKENLANVQDLGNKVIASAQHLPEVMTAIVSQIVTRSIQQGVGNVQAQIHREVSSVRNRVQTQINASVRQEGPGALYR